MIPPTTIRTSFNPFSKQYYTVNTPSNQSTIKKIATIILKGLNPIFLVASPVLLLCKLISNAKANSRIKKAEAIKNKTFSTPASTPQPEETFKQEDTKACLLLLDYNHTSTENNLQQEEKVIEDSNDSMEGQEIEKENLSMEEQMKETTSENQTVKPSLDFTTIVNKALSYFKPLPSQSTENQVEEKVALTEKSDSLETNLQEETKTVDVSDIDHMLKDVVLTTKKDEEKASITSKDARKKQESTVEDQENKAGKGKINRPISTEQTMYPRKKGFIANIFNSQVSGQIAPQRAFSSNYNFAFQRPLR